MKSSSKAGLQGVQSANVPFHINTVHLREVFQYLHAENEKDKTEVLRQLRSLISTLPSANYDLLKYLCQFLVFVTRHESENKMSPQALAIVFGPNLFR